MDDYGPICRRFLNITTGLLFVFLSIQCSSNNEEPLKKRAVISEVASENYIDSVVVNLKSYPLFRDADSLMLKLEYGKAIKVLNQLVPIVKNDIEQYTYVLSIIAECYHLRRDFEEAKRYISKSLNLAGDDLVKRKYFSSRIYFLFGSIFYSLGDPDSALFYLDKSLFIQKTYFRNYNFQAEIYNTIGNVYRNSLMEYDLSEEFFLKARKTLIRSSSRSKLAELSNLHHLAIIYRHKKDFEKSLNYSFKAINLCKNDPVYQKIWLASLYNLVGITYETNREYVKSISYYKKATEIASHFDLQFELGLYYNNLGIGYYYLSDYQNAQKYYRMGMENASKQKDYAVLSDALLNLGELFETLGSKDSAVYYIKKSFDLKRSIYKNHNPEVSLALLFLGNIFKNRKDYDSALYYYQEAFIQGIEGFNKKELSSNPKVAYILKNKNFIKILNLKGVTLKEKYLANNSIKYLLEAYECYQLLDKVLEEQKQFYDNEYSEIINNGNNKLIYDEAIEICYSLFQITYDNKYLKKALFFMEKNKSSLLSENLTRAHKLSGIGVSENAISRERLLKARVAFYKTKLYEYEISGDLEKADDIKEKIFDISEQLEAVTDSIYTRNPSYIQTRYSLTREPYKDVLSFLDKNKATFIEYYMAKDDYYVISISNSKSIFKRIAFTSEAAKQISTFKHSIASPDKYSAKRQNFLDFTNSAVFVYKYFLENLIPDKENTKELIIVPDGELTTIPFEATLTLGTRNEDNIDFKNLPYLIRKYNINYCFSLNIFFQDHPKDRGEGLVAFSYTNVKGLSDGNTWKELKGTRRELSLIENVGVEGSFFTDKEASEEKFKKHAQTAEIIHLAVHGNSDNLNPLNSKLIFNSSEKSNDDGELHYYELYNLNLRNKLVVLSACNTGVGKSMPGEGVMSLGRAFNYAGSQSIIMSLWNINDVITSSLMEDFYKYLLKDRDISGSLTNSKLEFISDADEISSHPVNWAGFIAYGTKNDLISPKSRNIYYFFGLGLLLFLIAILFVYRGKMTNSFPGKKKTGRISCLF